VDEVEHLDLGGVCAFFDPVEAQRLGRRAAALIQRGNESLAGRHLFGLLLVRHGRLHSFGFVLASTSEHIRRGWSCSPAVLDVGARRG
jgi:hypothetical protein